MVAALGDVEPGHQLGRYELLLPIAQGGMGSVWAARLKGSRGFQKIVSIKTLLPTVSNDPRFEKMFLDEAALASRIRHPHVVEILDLGEQDGLLYLVMEWVDGEPLNMVLRAAARQDGLPLAAAVRIASQVCRGLHAAHELRDDDGEPLGLVHRDVSPHNVLLSYEGVSKLVDFGVAKATSRLVETTEAGHIKGKIAYMAPEQVRCEEIDRRADVFATGILLYLLTLGRHPFKGETSTETAKHICGSRPVRPRELKSDYPRRLEQVVLKALAKEPEDRFETADKMAQALLRALPATRNSSDEEIATFMRSLFSERLERRRKAIQRALKMADAKSGERPAFEAEGQPWTPDHKESNSSLRALEIGEGTESKTTGERSPTGSSVLVAVPPTSPPEASQKRGRPLLLVGSVLVLGAAATAGLLASRSTGPAHADASSEHHAAAAGPASSTSGSAHASSHAKSPKVALKHAAHAKATDAGAALANRADGAATAKHPLHAGATTKPAAHHPKHAAVHKRRTGLKNPYEDLGF